MSVAFDAETAIAAFWKAQQAGTHFPADWRDRLRFDEAYRIQLGVIERRVAAGEIQVGWKVAQTSEAARQSFGFAEPIFGCVMKDGVRRSGHVYGPGDLIQPQCEPEVCVRLKSPLSGPVSMPMVRRAIDMSHPAFEVIEVRGDITGQKALAIADNAATKDIVLGDPVPFDDGWDLAALECRFLVNGKEPERGRGADILGDPLNAVVWLAGKVAQFGHELHAGTLVMTGSFTRARPLMPGDSAYAEFGNLGSVAVGIAS